MTHRYGIAVAAGMFLAIATSGCGSNPATKPGSSAGTKVVPSGISDPCAGVAGCDEMPASDVDGDGTLDRIGVAVPVDVKFGYPTTVTVLVSAGGRVKRVDAPSNGMLPGIGSGTSTDHPRPYVGSYRISRTKGADLVLNTAISQGSFGRYVVIGWQNDQPALVNSPRPIANTSTSGVPSEWMLGPSEGSYRGSSAPTAQPSRQPSSTRRTANKRRRAEAFGRPTSSCSKTTTGLRTVPTAFRTTAMRGCIPTRCRRISTARTKPGSETLLKPSRARSSLAPAVPPCR